VTSTEVTGGLLEGVEYGRGFFEVVKGVSPAAGHAYTLPDQFQYITAPLFVTAHLATSAQAGNRQIAVEYLDGNKNVYSRDAAPVVVAANGNVTVWWAHDRGSAYAVTNGDQFAGLSHDYIRPGYTIRINATNLDAADQFSAILLGVDRLPTGPRGYQLGRIDEHGTARHVGHTGRAVRP
jgi:hypothetical protein